MKENEIDMMMRKFIFGLVFLLTAGLTVVAQPQQGHQGQSQIGPRFSPEKFEAELQQFLVQEASLTPQEAAKFFPVYKEMNRKQRALYERQRQLGMIKPKDEKGCQKAIKDRDEIEVELKRIQQNYHNKFLDILPASKVYDVLNAEDRFHRRMLRKWSKPMGGMYHKGQK